MTYQALKEAVCKANREIVDAGLVLLTWGNASGADREAGVFAIKPSGVGYADLCPEAMVVLSIETGEVVEGHLRPSSDTPTHLELYRAFKEVGGIVHTHSTHATSFAQAGRKISCLGTTHADHFHGSIPVTRALMSEEVLKDYEANTGLVILEHFESHQLDAMRIPGALVASHGPFAWGATIRQAVENAMVIEEAARMAMYTYLLNPDIQKIPAFLLDKHFLRKHGDKAYYGQAAQKDATGKAPA